MQSLLTFIDANKPYFEAAQAVSAVLSVVGWIVGAALLAIAWKKISRFSVGPFSFELQEAVAATAAAARSWPPTEAGHKIDAARVRETVARAFEPKTLNDLLGKSVLWVDDNPLNNVLAVRALNKLGLAVEQVETTEAALTALAQRRFDLIISDMGRGGDMQAGYDLLAKVRAAERAVPFFIFAGSDSPAFRRQAEQRGAQLSTNDMLELVDQVIRQLGEQN